MMLWLIWDMLVPLALAFLAGLFLGWLFWRWRRLQITSEELAAMRRSSARYKSDADTLRNRNAELAERLRASTGASDSSTLQDLEAANKQVDKLREQLKMANRELARNQPARSQGKAVSRTGASQLRDSRSDKVKDLEAQLSASRRQIQELQRAIRTDDRPRAFDGDSDADLRQTTNSRDLHEEIAVRDKLIVTLKHSLEQYGAQQDSTALLAEIEIRDEKILSLENLLNDSQRVA